ncbi:carbohydrate ABC transporter permease [Aminobacter sp. HY435]|uniref:carbohydrate ABC transporter permease n=1 Tax=Aminobacter sp. HY435 TaxID=2970917 RepID=UPI0022B9BB02|nr:sugar ABC transporter permease [Aminobacter sp. HY435]
MTIQDTEFRAPRQRLLSPLNRIPNSVFAWLILLPAILGLCAFSIVPMATGIWRSLQGTGVDAQLSLAQYEVMFNDPIFRTALANNLLFSIVTVPVSLGLAMMMAVLVNRRFRGRALVRLAFFTPAMLPVVGAASIWLFMYQPDFGVINMMLEKIGFARQNLLGQPSTVLPSLMVVMIWKEAGFFMLLYLAALQSIPGELNEAAVLEGASEWYRFRRITFPLLMPTTLFASIVAIANSFKHVDFLFVMTNGGPANASNLLLYHIWDTAFIQFRPAYAAAVSTFLVSILVFLAVVQIRALDRRIHYR